MPNNRDGSGPTRFQRIELGAIAALIVALLGFAFWLGGLDREVDHVYRLLKDLKEEVDELRASSRALTSRLYRALLEPADSFR